MTVHPETSAWGIAAVAEPTASDASLFKIFLFRRCQLACVIEDWHQHYLCNPHFGSSKLCISTEAILFRDICVINADYRIRDVDGKLPVGEWILINAGYIFSAGMVGPLDGLLCIDDRSDCHIVTHPGFLWIIACALTNSIIHSWKHLSLRVIWSTSIVW